MVWIIGDSYVRHVAERATETMENNRGVDGIWGGLRWKSLLTFLDQSLRGRAVPDVLLHSGENDLGDVSNANVVAAMKKDLHHLHLWYPDMKIIFSGITQRCRWKAGANPGNIDMARKALFIFVNIVFYIALYALPCSVHPLQPTCSRRSCENLPPKDMCRPTV